MARRGAACWPGGAENRWEAIEPDVWKVTAVFLKFLRTVVALFAQALKRT